MTSIALYPYSLGWLYWFQQHVSCLNVWRSLLCDRLFPRPPSCTIIITIMVLSLHALWLYCHWWWWHGDVGTRDVGMLSTSPAFYWESFIYRTLAFPLLLTGISSDAKAHKWRNVHEYCRSHVHYTMNYTIIQYHLLYQVWISSHNNTKIHYGFLKSINCHCYIDNVKLQCNFPQYTIRAPENNQDSKVHLDHMGPTWVQSAPGGPLVGPMNIAISGKHCCNLG